MRIAADRAQAGIATPAINAMKIAVNRRNRRDNDIGEELSAGQ